jgi:hypothetical protein
MQKALNLETGVKFGEKQLKMIHYDVEDIVNLAKEVDAEDPIDWGMLQIDEDTAFNIIASGVIEKFKDNDMRVALAVITKLIVENFVLNVKLNEPKI